MATKTTAKSPVKKASAKVTPAKKKAKPAIKKIDAAEGAATVRLGQAQKVARQVWFAGLGAFGRTVEEVQGRYVKAGEEIQARYTKLNKDRQELVDDLVTRGEKVQDEAGARLKESRASVDEQIEVAKSRLIGLTSVVDIPARLQSLSDKLESLSKDLKKSA